MVMETIVIIKTIVIVKTIVLCRGYSFLAKNYSFGKKTLVLTKNYSWKIYTILDKKL